MRVLLLWQKVRKVRVYGSLQSEMLRKHTLQRPCNCYIKILY